MINIALYHRLTPRLLGTCRNDLIKLCQLPTNWTLNKEMNDVQVGKYLSCLYQQKQQVNEKKRLSDRIYIYILFYSAL